MCTFSCLWICSETFLPRAPQAILWWAPSPSSFYFSQRCHSQTQLLKNCIQFTEWVWNPMFSCMRKEICSLYSGSLRRSNLWETFPSTQFTCAWEQKRKWSLGLLCLLSEVCFTRGEHVTKVNPARHPCISGDIYHASDRSSHVLNSVFSPVVERMQNSQPPWSSFSFMEYALTQNVSACLAYENWQIICLLGWSGFLNHVYFPNDNYWYYWGLQRAGQLCSYLI